MRYIPEYDGVRGILSSLVVVGHIYPRLGIWGWGSMDMFFTMSGFLIGSILIKGQEKPGFYREYVLRRIFKIWPSYYCVLIIVILLALIQSGVAQHPFPFSLPPSPGTTRSIFFLQNTEQWFSTQPEKIREIGYIPFFDHTWSVALEEQFYIIAPFLCLIISKSKNPLAFSALVAIVVVTLNIIGRASGNSLVTLPARGDGFVIGIFTAYLVNRFLNVSQSLKFILSCIAMIISTIWLVVLYFRYLPSQIGAVNYLFVYGVTGFSIFAAGLLVLLDSKSSNSKLVFLRTKYLLTLGRISYSTYLWHIPVIYVISMVLHKLGIVSLGIEITLKVFFCYFISYYAYKAIEWPMLNFRKRFTK